MKSEVATLFLVHAHPDDESIFTGGTILRAKEQGHRVVLVTATRGEEGEVHNLDEASTRPRLAEVRTAELERACEILGVDRLVFLGYRDSGMAGSTANQDPASFHQAPLTEAAARLAALLRQERPQVVVTYGPEGGYGHPDHVKAYLVTLAALDLLAQEGWTPAKLYCSVIPRSWLRQMEKRLWEAGGGELAGEIRLLGTPDEEVTTAVDVHDLVPRKLAAFAAHVSQDDPASPFRTAQHQLLEAALGVEHFALIRGQPGSQLPEPSLFVGVA